jgi:hypothetical protein
MSLLLADKSGLSGAELGSLLERTRQAGWPAKETGPDPLSPTLFQLKSG